MYSIQRQRLFTLSWKTNRRVSLDHFSDRLVYPSNDYLTEYLMNTIILQTVISESTSAVRMEDYQRDRSQDCLALLMLPFSEKPRLLWESSAQQRSSVGLHMQTLAADLLCVSLLFSFCHIISFISKLQIKLIVPCIFSQSYLGANS